ATDGREGRTAPDRVRHAAGGAFANPGPFAARAVDRSAGPRQRGGAAASVRRRGAIGCRDRSTPRRRGRSPATLPQPVAYRAALLEESDTPSASTAMNHSEQPQANDWQERLFLIEDMMRDMSRHTDPQAMVRSYGERMRQLAPVGRSLSLSRRGLTYPQYRVTRSTTWAEEVNPWKEKDRLPLLTGGLLAELIYGDKTAVL